MTHVTNSETRPATGMNLDFGINARTLPGRPQWYTELLNLRTGRANSQVGTQKLIDGVISRLDEVKTAFTDMKAAKQSGLIEFGKMIKAYETGGMAASIEFIVAVKAGVDNYGNAIKATLHALASAETAVYNLNTYIKQKKPTSPKAIQSILKGKNYVVHAETILKNHKQKVPTENELLQAYLDGRTVYF